MLLSGIKVAFICPTVNGAKKRAETQGMRPQKNAHML
jgi:hypothetical protein